MPFITNFARNTQHKQYSAHCKQSTGLPQSSTSPPQRRQKMIGDYLLGRTIGRGASARVRLGIHRHTGERVAIKLVSRSQLAKSGTLTRCVERELAVLQLLHHPNLVNLHQVLQDANYVYFVMDYLEGGELFQLLAESGKLTEDYARHLFRQLISALSWCHTHYICHRDLKPENILLDKEHKVLKIVDFGMAAMQSPGVVLKTSCGSPHYASPEIIRGKPYYGATTDIWSCGIILYAMLSGHLPFDDNNVSRLLAKIKTGRYIPIPSWVSCEAKNLIKSMLVVDPSKRINLEAILAHPWLTNKSFLGTDLRSPDALPLSQKTHDPLHDQDLEQPLIADALDLDGRVLKTLKVLWNDLSQDQILAALMSYGPNLQKLTCKLLKQRAWREKHPHQEEESQSCTSPRSLLINEDSPISLASPPLIPVKHSCRHHHNNDDNLTCSPCHIPPNSLTDTVSAGRTMAVLPPTPPFDLDSPWHSELQKEFAHPELLRKTSCTAHCEVIPGLPPTRQRHLAHYGRSTCQRKTRHMMPSVLDKQATPQPANPLVSRFTHAHATWDSPSLSLSSARTALHRLQKCAQPSRSSSSQTISLANSVMKWVNTGRSWYQRVCKSKNDTKTFSFELQAKHEYEAAGKLHQLLEEHFDSKLSGRLYPSGQIMWSGSMLLPEQERLHFLCHMSLVAPDRVRANLVAVQGNPSMMETALQHLLHLWNVYESEATVVSAANGWRKE